jgi:hypothetical protein
MTAFSMKAFLSLCVQDLGEFSSLERAHRPENRLMLETPASINAKFNRGLDEIRKACNLISEELYISTWTSGEISVNFGAMLEALKIEFQAPPKMFVRLECMRLKEKFRFESEMAKEYNRCVAQYKHHSQEIRQAFNARFASRGDLLNAIDHVSKVVDRLSVHVALLGLGPDKSPAKRLVNMQLQHSRRVLERLRGYAFRK